MKRTVPEEEHEFDYGDKWPGGNEFFAPVTWSIQPVRSAAESCHHY